MSGIVCHFAKSTDGVCRNSRCAEVCQGRSEIRQLTQERKEDEEKFGILGNCSRCKGYHRLVDGLCAQCLRSQMF